MRRGIPLAPLLAAGAIAGAAACAVFAPQLAPYDPTTGDLAARLRPPTWMAAGGAAHPLGTDQLGRDILSRVIYGARVSLLVGLVSSLIGGSVGLVLGVVGGYFRGRADAVIAKAIDVQLAFPFILFAITIIAVLGASLRNLLIVLAISGWVTYARVVRGQTLSLREHEFIHAARGLGCPAWRIVARHVVPNVLPYALVIMTTEIGRLIVLESTLSFLGLGVPPPTPSWGMALADGKDYLVSGWWLATFPGLAIMLIVLSMNIMGDGIRDLLEPRLRGRRGAGAPEGATS
ncbi:MAG TPA: ABC transporter permease [Methylomirabilota bacterium]|nr:ABC transporter permease [Methylomirabilota bacterium]